MNWIPVALRPTRSSDTVDEGERVPCFTRFSFPFVVTCSLDAWVRNNGADVPWDVFLVGQAVQRPG